MKNIYVSSYWNICRATYRCPQVFISFWGILKFWDIQVCMCGDLSFRLQTFSVLYLQVSFQAMSPQSSRTRCRRSHLPHFKINIFLMTRRTIYTNLRANIPRLRRAHIVTHARNFTNILRIFLLLFFSLHSDRIILNVF